MEFFQRAKSVRLRSQHNKYLIAEDNEDGIKQSRSGSSKQARWTVEQVEGKPNLIRLKNCDSWRYLSASDEPFLLGMTGRKVLQASPRMRLDPAVEWEPIKEGSYVKLRTRRGHFLRANGGIPPWMNSVTHDVPSRSSTQDWILWSVDVLEVIYQSPTVTEGSVVESNGVDQDQDRIPDYPDLEPDKGSEALSRSSSNSSSVSMSKMEEEYYDVGSPVKSMHSSMEIPSPRASPKASVQSAGASPHIQHLRHDSQHSNSFNKLKSMLDGVQDLLDDKEEENKKSYDEEPEYSSVDSHSHPHQIEVKMAKQTLRELRNMDYNELLSSGRDKKLEKAVSILIADAKASTKGQLREDVVGLQDRIKAMKVDHEMASQDLVEWTTFLTRRVEVKAGLKRDAAKAHELETMEVGFSNMLLASRAKREELLKQLEEVENSIRAAERAQADNAVEIEELITRIGDKSESLREMERQEKSWQERKSEAEMTLERVEEEWVQVKSLFQDV